MSVGSKGWRRLAAMMGVVGLLLAGCATEQGQISSTGGGGAAPAPPAPGAGPGTVVPGTGTIIPPIVTPPVTRNYPRSIQDTNAGKAVLSLYRQAQDARAAGHPDQAEALLERALHIESRNPFVWQALAGAHMDLNHPDQAESAAQKSTSLGRGNPYIEAGNWRLIAAARQARGDSGGALQAQARADDIARALSAE